MFCKRIINTIIKFLICIMVLALLTCCSNADSIEEKLVASITKEINEPAVLFDEEETPAFLAYLEEESCCEIVSYVSDEELITATVKVTSLDLCGAVVNVVLEDYSDESQIDEMITQQLKDLPFVENEVELSFEVNDGEYNPILTDEFLDIYYGGVLSLRDSMINDYSGVN